MQQLQQQQQQQAVAGRSAAGADLHSPDCGVIGYGHPGGTLSTRHGYEARGAVESCCLHLPRVQLQAPCVEAWPGAGGWRSTPAAMRLACGHGTPTVVYYYCRATNAMQPTHATLHAHVPTCNMHGEPHTCTYAQAAPPWPSRGSLMSPAIHAPIGTYTNQSRL